jgi:hypothetical protein
VVPNEAADKIKNTRSAHVGTYYYPLTYQTRFALFVSFSNSTQVHKLTTHSHTCTMITFFALNTSINAAHELTSSILISQLEFNHVFTYTERKHFVEFDHVFHHVFICKGCKHLVEFLPSPTTRMQPEFQ